MSIISKLRFNQQVSMGFMSLNLIAPSSKPIFILIFSKNVIFEKTNSKYWKNNVWVVLPLIFLAKLIHAPFGIFNPGSAISWRENFELLLYFIPLVLYWESKKNA